MATGQTRDIRIITKKTAIPGRIPTGTTGNELNFIRQGELAQNTYDKKLFGFDGTDVFEFGVNTFLNLTGGTISGNVDVNGSLSADTFISGSTNLYDIFLTAGDLSGTSVSQGSNILVQQTGNDYKVSVVSSPSFDNILFSGVTTGGALSATSISAATAIYSAGTNLYSIFQTQAGTLKQKNGSVTGTTFAGNPKKATVTFTNPFSDNNYAVTVTGEISRSWSIESKTASGFTINANANAAFTSNVFWMAGQIGESI